MHIARLEATSSLLSTLPARAVISARDLMAIVGFDFCALLVWLVESITIMVRF